MMSQLFKAFGEELVVLNAKYRDLGLNAPTRTNWMMQMALMTVDAFKVGTHPNKEALTEKEFLDLAKTMYWKTREQVQAGDVLQAQNEASKIEVVEVPVERKCETCLNRCMDMDMDPYCVAVNKPAGRMLYSGQPPECGPEFKLWERDTRGK